MTENIQTRWAAQLKIERVCVLCCVVLCYVDMNKYTRCIIHTVQCMIDIRRCNYRCECVL